MSFSLRRKRVSPLLGTGVDAFLGHGWDSSVGDSPLSREDDVTPAQSDRGRQASSGAEAGDPRRPPRPDRQTRYAVIAARVAAYPGLPVDDGARGGVRRRTEDWLVRARSAHTEKARAHDLGMFLAWCDEQGIDPLTARPADIGWYRVWRELHGAGGRCAKPTTVARALASISSWYTHLAVTAGGSITHNPLIGASRPPVSAYAAGSPGRPRTRSTRCWRKLTPRPRTAPGDGWTIPPRNGAASIWWGYAIVRCCACWPIWVFVSVRRSSVTSQT